jgi:hypothetical protein
VRARTEALMDCASMVSDMDGVGRAVNGSFGGEVVDFVGARAAKEPPLTT